MTKEELIASDKLWLEHKEFYGWEIPKTHWALRLPVIRYIRFVFYNIQIYRWTKMWSDVGIGVGLPNQRDLWFAYAVMRGWC